jgi:integrase
MVLLATFAGLRFGELAGLTRRHVDLLHGTVKVAQQIQELADGRRVVVPPKTDAARRTVAVPPHLLPELEAHLAAWAESGAGGLVFPAPESGPIRRSNFNRRVWQPACRVAGVEGLRFHDLRHTGNTLAAATGASTRELMVRMGHASPRAALIYQHATADRDAAIARALSDLAAARNPAPVVPLPDRS